MCVKVEGVTDVWRQRVRYTLRFSGATAVICGVVSRYAYRGQWLGPCVASVGMAVGAALIAIGALLGRGRWHRAEVVMTFGVFAVLWVNALLEAGGCQ